MASRVLPGSMASELESWEWPLWRLAARVLDRLPGGMPEESAPRVSGEKDECWKWEEIGETSSFASWQPCRNVSENNLRDITSSLFCSLHPGKRDTTLNFVYLMKRTLNLQKAVEARDHKSIWWLSMINHSIWPWVKKNWRKKCLLHFFTNRIQ